MERIEQTYNNTLKTSTTKVNKIITLVSKLGSHPIHIYMYGENKDAKGKRVKKTRQAEIPKGSNSTSYKTSLLRMLRMLYETILNINLQYIGTRSLCSATNIYSGDEDHLPRTETHSSGPGMHKQRGLENMDTKLTSQSTCKEITISSIVNQLRTLEKEKWPS